MSKQSHAPIEDFDILRFRVVPTGGQGLLCGVRALRTSLNSQAGLNIDEDTIKAAVSSSISEELGVELYDGDITYKNNFNIDQMMVGSAALGAFGLVVV